MLETMNDGYVSKSETCLAAAHQFRCEKLTVRMRNWCVAVRQASTFAYRAGVNILKRWASALTFLLLFGGGTECLAPLHSAIP